VSSHKSILVAAAIAVCVHFFCGCRDVPGSEAGLSNNQNIGADNVREPARAGGGEIDLGEDWFAGRRPGVESGTAVTAEEARSSFWTVVLGTFTSAGHETAAANLVRSCAAIDARLAGARVHTSSKGSMVIYGMHEAADSPAARRDLAWIKGMQVRGQQVFPRAMLTRINLRHAQRQFKPNELLSVRQRYPDIDPLYTLQVAAWGDFGSGELSAQAIQRRAEAYTRELRACGHEAYFHHDDDQHLSVVTVGLFGQTAIDPESGLFSPEVEALLRVFPKHLVNGEVFNEPVNPRFPSLGTRVQRPTLVLVPQL